MRRYIGMTQLDDDTIVGIEVRAKNQTHAKSECRAIIDCMMPGEDEASDSVQVCRLKEKGGIWRPVDPNFTAVLFDVDMWLSPKNVELTDFAPETSGQIIPFVPASDTPKPKVKAKAGVKKALVLGLDEEFIKSIGTSIRKYNSVNEVIT